MKKIWAVTEGSYDDYEILSVWDDEEVAKSVCSAYGSVEEYRVYSKKDVKVVHHIKIVNGEVGVMDTMNTLEIPSDNVNINGFVPDGNPKIWGDVYSSDPEEVFAKAKAYIVKANAVIKKCFVGAHAYVRLHPDPTYAMYINRLGNLINREWRKP